MDNKLSEIKAALEGAGFNPKEIVPDGRIHRFRRDANDKGRSAWYLAFQNTSQKGELFYVCRFGDWREQGEEKTVISTFTQSKHDKRMMEAQVKDIGKRLEAERKSAAEQAARDSEIEWKRFRDRGESEYLARKGFPGELFGCRVIPGRTFVPVRDLAGKLWGYQTIGEYGEKFFREGTRKEGNFHLIGDARDAESGIIYFAEGLATAASVNRATGRPCVVCFDSGNLSSVIAAFKAHRKDLSIVICGDDDRWATRPDGSLHNAGRESAESAAHEHLTKAIFPEFQSLADRPTDFNDLHLLEGLERVREQLSGVKVESHRVICLGHAAENYYYISTSNQQIVSIARGAHAKGTFLDLMPMIYWESQYPGARDDSVDWDRAASELMEECRRNGVFQPERIRGGGVWRDEKKTVVNLGNRLWVDGEVKPLNSFKSRYTYEISSRIENIHPEPVTREEGLAFVDALELLKWKKPEFAKLLAGWMMISPLSGAMPWRPHVWINGPSGSGKSWIMAMINEILGENRFFFQGNTTEAGIRQSIRSDARAVIFDEFETDDERSSERIRSILELLRQASYETDGVVVKGTTTGKSMQYRVRFSALVASVRLNLEREQDKNRFTVLDLERVTGTDKASQFKKLKAALASADAEYGRRMFSRGVRLLPVILANQGRFYDALSDKYNSRFGQQYGALLAGYGALIHDEPLADDEVRYIVDSLDLNTEAEVTDDQDERECLDYLMQRVVSLDFEGKKQDLSFSRAIRDFHTELTEGVKKIISHTLQQYGIKLQHDELIVVSHHPYLKSLFRGTKWTAGYDKALLRIPGALRKTTNVNGKMARCVAMPIRGIGYEWTSLQ